MKVWVLSLEKNNEFGNLITGVWGVYSSLYKAMEAYHQYRTICNETQLNYTTHCPTLITFTTDKGIWRMESITMDS